MLTGVVYDPTRDEYFTASRAASLNGAPIRSAGSAGDTGAMLLTGFPKAGSGEATPDDFERFAVLLASFLAVRRMGSTALHLAYVACGRADVTFEIRTNSWDLAAGSVPGPAGRRPVPRASRAVDPRRPALALAELHRGLSRVRSGAVVARPHDLGRPDRGTQAERLAEEEDSPMQTRRLTMAQAIVAFLKQQYVERDGREQRFFAGCFGIFGHGNVAGIGQALHQDQDPAFPYYQPRNEQAMVHIAAAFAKQSNRLRTFACTTSVGPGATNMLTAAAARHHQPPPGPAPAGRRLRPAQRRSGAPAARVSARARRLGQRRLPAGLAATGTASSGRSRSSRRCSEAMRVLTSPAETGAVTLALPQDVQAEAVRLSRGASSRSGSGTSPASRRTGACSSGPSR